MRGAERASEITGRQAVQASVNRRRLRPLPNEDVYLFVKKIDNSRVVRQADPAARRECWKAIAVSCTAAALAVGVLLPGAYSLLAGYQIQTLEQERQTYKTQLAALELEEARLLSPERLQHLARMQQFIEPSPDTLVYLQPTDDGSLAMDLTRK
jgi:hypothetical protein